MGEEWPDQYIEPEHGRNENFAQVWINTERTVLVQMDAKIFASTGEANDTFDGMEATPSDPGDYPLASEAFVSDDGTSGRCVFRDSNAIGVVLSSRYTGGERSPDRGRATTYAEYMYAEWPGVEE